MRELPDWGKLIFPPTKGKAWEEVLPGVSPAALELMQGLIQYNPGEKEGGVGGGAARRSGWGKVVAMGFGIA